MSPTDRNAIIIQPVEEADLGNCPAFKCMVSRQYEIGSVAHLPSKIQIPKFQVQNTGPSTARVIEIQCLAFIVQAYVSGTEYMCGDAGSERRRYASGEARSLLLGHQFDGYSSAVTGVLTSMRARIQTN